jgi:hypothetical protein
VYPVNSSNNTVVFSVNSILGVTYTATITAGNYTGTTFAAALQTALNAAGSGVVFTVAYSSTTFKITITCGGVDEILIRAPSFGTTFNNISGFRTTLVGFQNSVTGDSVVNLAGTSLLKLYVNFSTDSVSSDNSNNLLAVIPVSVSPFSYIFYNEEITTIPVIVSCRDTDLNNMRIMLLDDNNEIWNLDDDFPYTLTLNVSAA